MSMPSSSFDRAIQYLVETITERAENPDAGSYTSQLLEAGPAKCAKKLGEEGVETALAVASEPDDAVASEAADLLFHLLVALKSRNVSLDDVGDALIKRQGLSGLDEKAQRPSTPSGST